MKIFLASDSTGETLKLKLLDFLRGNGFAVINLPSSENEQYPDIGHRAAKKRIASGEFQRGILICGTGMGMAMIANKVRGVFAGACNTPELAKRLAESNGAQILAIGSDFISTLNAKHTAIAFLMAETALRPNAERMRALESQS